MPDLAAFMETMKKQAVRAVEAGNPVNFFFGTVISVAPLQIAVDQQLTLDQDQLVLSRNVTQHTVRVSMAWSTGKTGGGSGEKAFEDHTHTVTGGTLTVHNALTAGEKVLIARQQEGQKYIVLDRVVGL
ncbi:MAG: DUF2577 domain-containing protein [Clostridium sp.]|nr:DUF2577 domain-containing protein [Clostridium sp.]